MRASIQTMNQLREATSPSYLLTFCPYLILISLILPSDRPQLVKVECKLPRKAPYLIGLQLKVKIA